MNIVEFGWELNSDLSSCFSVTLDLLVKYKVQCLKDIMLYSSCLNCKELKLWCCLGKFNIAFISYYFLPTTDFKYFFQCGMLRPVWEQIDVKVK